MNNGHFPMKKEHQALIDQFKKNEKILERSGIKTVVLEVLMIGIVCYMKSIQETASLKANIIATSLVTALLCLHFLDFLLKKAWEITKDLQTSLPVLQKDVVSLIISTCFRKLLVLFCLTVPKFHSKNLHKATTILIQSAFYWEH